jgi:hypothetical protein
MADDVVDYSGTGGDSDSESASDKAPSTGTVAMTGRLPAPAGSCILRMPVGLASFTGMQTRNADAHQMSPEKNSIAV